MSNYLNSIFRNKTTGRVQLVIPFIQNIFLFIYPTADILNDIRNTKRFYKNLEFFAYSFVVETDYSNYILRFLSYG